MTLPDRVFGSSEVRKFGDDGDLPGFGDGSNVGGHLSLEFGDQDVAGVFDTFRHDSNPAGIIRRRASYERSSSGPSSRVGRMLDVGKKNPVPNR